MQSDSNLALIVIFKHFQLVNSVENVYADTQVSMTYAAEKAPEKLKRSAFVFITADCDECNIALEDLRKIREVQEVYLARGAYDIVAKVSGDSLDSLREDVLKRIKNLGSIKSTLTLTVI